MLKRKSKFWTFLLSLVPGVGHMYLGLKRQGVQLMFLFFFCIFVLSILDLSILGIFLPIIWFYSMFDAMSKVSSDEIPMDDDIAIVKWLKDNGPYVKNKHKILGYSLVVLGGYMILERILFPMFDMYISWRVREFMQTGIIAFLLIAVGIKLLAGSKHKLDN